MAIWTGGQTLTNKVLTNPTINAATMTGAIANYARNNTKRQYYCSHIDPDPELDGSGGVAKILANATVVGTLTSADITNTNNITTTQLDGWHLKTTNNNVCPMPIRTC